jgi:hypothetical protein
MELSFKANTADVQKVLDQLGRDQLPFASSLALNRTMYAVKEGVVGEMKSVFDRPTSFTLNSLFTKASTKANLVAYVGIKDESFKAQAPSRWLAPVVMSGPRGMKRFEERLRSAGVLGPNEYAVPGSGAKLDAYGNMGRGQIVAILSDVQAHWDTTQNSTRASRAKRSRRRTKRGGIYFATRAGGHLRPGVYERIGFGFGSAVRPVLIFTNKVPTYRKLLDMERVGKTVMAARYSTEFNRAMSEAISTAIVKRAA